MATITAYKCTRANGRDFHSNSVEYAIGAMIEVADPDLSSAPCGRGLHCSPTAKMTCRYGERSIDRGKWRWFEVQFDEADLLGKDDTKFRVRRLRVVRELTIVDVFGSELGERVKQVRAEMSTWKDIPWLKPAKTITEDDLRPILARWHDATSFWLAQRGDNRAIPRAARIITDRAGAIVAARSADAAAADAAADADAADAAAADAAAADAAAAAAAAAADAADAAAAAAAADAADADADADAAADAADADADAAAAAAWRPSWLWWYLRPYWVLRRHAWWSLGALTEPSPYAPLVELYRMGVMPLGFVDGALCIYCPPPAVASKEAA